MGHMRFQIFGRDMMNKLDELLSGEEPEEKAEFRKEFKPKFNVREEFALWIREQFPRLQDYAKKKEEYKLLESRREEVYQAALGAVNHGVNSTEVCAMARLRRGWNEFEKGFGAKGNPKKRAKSLESFVKALEELSISLGGDKHYTEAGKSLSGSYSYGWSGNLNAYVYRLGNKNGKDTEYLVFDAVQEFKEDSGKKPVLIGELSQLTKWNFEDLQKIASKFRGSESDFIKEVDRKVPEAGTYEYSGYGHGYSGYGSYSSSSYTGYGKDGYSGWSGEGGDYPGGVR